MHKIEVGVQGEPPPKITWTSKGEPIKVDRIMIDTSEENKTTFVLTKAQRKDTGTYTITAKNDSGVDEASFDITVLSELASGVFHRTDMAIEPFHKDDH